MRITTPEVFRAKTSLLIDVQVQMVLAEKPHDLTPEQVAWFIDHCEWRFRYFYEKRPDWRRWLENRNRRIDPHDQSRVWLRHWLAAYVLAPVRYQQRWDEDLVDFVNKSERPSPRGD